MGALFFKLSQNINTLNFPSNESMLQLAYVMALCGVTRKNGKILPSVHRLKTHYFKSFSLIAPVS